MHKAVFSRQSLPIFFSLVCIVSHSSERGKKSLHCSKTEDLLHYINGPLVSFLFITIASFSSWIGIAVQAASGLGRSLWPPPCATQIRFLEKLVISFMCCIYHDHNLPHIYISLFWFVLPLKGLCHARGLTWLWGVSTHLWKTLFLFHCVFGRKEWRRGLGEEEALTENKGEDLISSH